MTSPRSWTLGLAAAVATFFAAPALAAPSLTHAEPDSVASEKPESLGKQDTDLFGNPVPASPPRQIEERPLPQRDTVNGNRGGGEGSRGRNRGGGDRDGARGRNRGGGDRDGARGRNRGGGDGDGARGRNRGGGDGDGARRRNRGGGDGDGARRRNRGGDGARGRNRGRGQDWRENRRDRHDRGRRSHRYRDHHGYDWDDFFFSILVAPPRTYSSGHRPGYSYGYPSDYGYTSYSSRYEQLSYSAIRRNLRREGFSQVRLVDDLGDAYLIDAIDPQGIQVRLVVSSLDGQILEARARQSVSLAGGPPTGPIGAPGSFDDIGRGLEQAGYRSISVVEFDGRTYVVSAQDPRGPNVRLEIDGATGQLIRQSFF